MNAEMKEVVLTLMAGRAYVFSLLHKMLGAEPTKTLMDAVSSEESMQAVALFESEDSDAAKKLGNVLLACRGMDEERLDRVREEYTRLFIGPDKLIAAPWESVYTTKERALFQESTLDVRGWFRRFGYVAGGYPNYPDDHISLMMDFLARTSQMADEQLALGEVKACAAILGDQAEFERVHMLNWLYNYAKDMQLSASNFFYPQLAVAIAEFIAYDQQVIEEIVEACAA